MGVGRVYGSTSIKLNGGDDGFHAESFNFDGKLEIDGGAGTDSYFFYQTTPPDRAKIQRFELIVPLDVYF